MSYRHRLMATLLLAIVLSVSGTATADDDDRIPIIIVPGYEGSELRISSQYAWPPIDVLLNPNATVFGRLSQRLGSLILVPDSSPNYRMIPLKNPVETEILTMSGVGWPYKGFKDHLKSKGYTDEDILEFAYDWRQSNMYNARLLHKTIQHWRQKNTNKNKFVIVAHSMGGLVTRYYLANYGASDQVAAAVYCGTPFRGLCAPTQALFTNEINLGSIGLLLQRGTQVGAPNWLRRGLLSWPSTCELSFPGCVEFAGAQLDPANVSSWRDLLRKARVADSDFALMESDAPKDWKNFREVISKEVRTVPEYYVFSDSAPTPRKVVGSTDWLGRLKWTIRTVPGDGTVMAESALSGQTEQALSSSGRVFPVREPGKALHGSLLAHADTHDFIWDLLTNRLQSQPVEARNALHASLRSLGYVVTTDDFRFGSNTPNWTLNQPGESVVALAVTPTDSNAGFVIIDEVRITGTGGVLLSGIGGSAALESGHIEVPKLQSTVAFSIGKGPGEVQQVAARVHKFRPWSVKHVVETGILQGRKGSAVAVLQDTPVAQPQPFEWSPNDPKLKIYVPFKRQFSKQPTLHAQLIGSTFASAPLVLNDQAPPISLTVERRGVTADGFFATLERDPSLPEVTGISINYVAIESD